MRYINFQVHRPTNIPAYMHSHIHKHWKVSAEAKYKLLNLQRQTMKWEANIFWSLHDNILTIISIITLRLVLHILKLRITYGLIRVDKLHAAVSRQHVDDNDLAPFFNIDEKVAKLAVVLVDEVDSFWTDLLKCLNGTTCNQLHVTQRDHFLLPLSPSPILAFYLIFQLIYVFIKSAIYSFSSKTAILSSKLASICKYYNI